MTTIELLRQYRLGGYAIFDFAISYLGIWLLSPLLTRLFKKIRLDIPKINWLFFVLPLAIIVHILVGNFTPFTKNFLDLNGHYILKLVVLISLVLGFRGVKIIKK
ncbi:MAG: hypothetical protein US42_C0002G0077 [Candidatus Magasanikbacteria bacterium GW2011_GWC2_37_14]|uniref:Uncharacterized protein n=1 Tax=Candidatus Magasanikbacteria bacterium GW2011_GWC2_37_14 TaxID=1619046 RepID=A0A0G0GDS4_9BACT|nr:MAG: hypothetical protein US42_C0002G0077 [Candidatus Magasanikbacteria bacterium GW2011_GWC2_37_14]